MAMGAGDSRGHMDDHLKILKNAAAPDALAQLDDEIFAALAERQRESAAVRRMMICAGFMALGLGVVAGGAMPRPAEAAAMSPLVPSSPLTQVGLAGAY